MKTRIFIILFVAVIFSSCSNDSIKEAPVAKTGVLDISEWDFEKDGFLILGGEWGFTYKNLLDPDDYQTKDIKEIFVKVPGYWNDYKNTEEKAAGKAYGTYRLNIKSNKEIRSLVVGTGEAMSSAKVWFNGELLSEQGVVSEDVSKSVPKSVYDAKAIDIKNGDNILIVQVTNNSHRNGGMFKAFELGSPKSIINKRRFGAAVDYFLFGSIIIMVLYHLGLFFLWKKEKSTLYFGLFALLIAIRTLTNGEQNIKLIIPDLDWTLRLRIEYFTFILAHPFLGMFLCHLFPKEFNKKLMLISLYIGIATSLSVLVLSSYNFSFIVNPYQILLLAFSLYAVVMLTIASIRKRSGALIFLFGGIILFATTINDILYIQKIIDTAEIISIGLFIFIFAQAYIIAMRFSKAFFRNEELTEELNFQNKHLEEIVEERTVEIKQQNEEILSQKEELLAINDELTAQTDELQNLYGELKFHSDQTKAAINYAQTIQKATLPDIDTLNRYFDKFLIYKPKDVVSGDFYWFNLMPAGIDTEILETRFIAVADCTGHGVPGAFMSMISTQLLSEIVNERHIHSPAKILDEMDKSLRRVLKQDKTDNRDGLDICFCKIEKHKSGKKILTYSGAKICLYRFNSKNNEVERIVSSRKSIGGYLTKNNKKFEEVEIELNTSDIIYLSSDGYIDQNDNERIRFGTPRFIELISKAAQKDLLEQKQMFEQELEKHMFGTKQRDDITMLGIKIR